MRRIVGQMRACREAKPTLARRPGQTWVWAFVLSLLLGGCSANHSSPPARRPLRNRVCDSWSRVEFNLSALANGPPAINDATGDVQPAFESKVRLIVDQAKGVERQAHALAGTSAGFGMTSAANSVVAELSPLLNNPTLPVDVGQYEISNPSYAWADGYCAGLATR